MRAHDRVIPLYGANVWLHRNEPGEHDRFADARPFLVELHRGIGITTGADLYPRLPLLGARALRTGNLRVSLDYRRGRLSARTGRKFWFFG
jgi:hypothetical protein